MNWIQAGLEGIPAEVKDTLSGEAPGFADAKALEFRPAAGSALIDAGVSGEEYLKAVRIVTQFSRAGESVEPSPEWLKAVDEIERATPAYEPLRKAAGYKSRASEGAMDIGAYEFVKAK
jgi:hypothetical protein